jgi:hypothetical protein
MFHQSSFQGGQAFGASQNRYQPAGFVQSQYQGQLSRSAASGPVTAKFGYQAGQPQSFAGQPIQQSFAGQAGAFQTSAVVQKQGDQHPVYRATNAYQQEGPVIQQLGYQAGVQQQNIQKPFGQQQFAGQTGATSFAAQQHPVYRATNAYQQEGPVIQHTGYQAGVQQQNFQKPFGQQPFAGQTGVSSFAAGSQQQWQQHPVYSATNARQQAGPVNQQLGWQAGSAAGQQNRYI